MGSVENVSTLIDKCFNNIILLRKLRGTIHCLTKRDIFHCNKKHRIKTKYVDISYARKYYRVVDYEINCHRKRTDNQEKEE